MKYTDPPESGITAVVPSGLMATSLGAPPTCRVLTTTRLAASMILIAPVPVPRRGGSSTLSRLVAKSPKFDGFCPYGGRRNSPDSISLDDRTPIAKNRTLAAESCCDCDVEMAWLDAAVRLQLIGHPLDGSTMARRTS